MLRIRSEQLDAFRLAKIGEFETRMLRHVESNYKKEFAALGGAEPVLELIRRTIAHGQHLGFTAMRDIAALIDLTVVYGERFEDHTEDPAIRDILHDPEITPSSRIELVLRELPDD